MNVEIEGQTYTVVRGSDVDRDGMYLELKIEGQPAEVAEVFYADETGEFSVTTFENRVPLAAMEWLIRQSRELLPPIE